MVENYIILSGSPSKQNLRIHYTMLAYIVLFLFQVSLEGELVYLDVVHLYSNANYLHALI